MVLALLYEEWDAGLFSVFHALFCQPEAWFVFPSPRVVSVAAPHQQRWYYLPAEAFT
jgi:hypothetical protein